LGALNDFGRLYRKPIEAETDEEKVRVKELRAKIGPQILRRTKKDVAKDLKAKIIVENCLNLPLSGAQRALYGQAIELFKRRNDPNVATPFKNHLSLLHYLRLVCVDPRR
jgi:SNF2 family DNA or RNA helicase